MIIKLTADFSTETRKYRRKESDILKLLKGKNKTISSQPRSVYPVKIFFKNEDIIKMLLNKQSWENVFPATLH